MGIIEDNIIPPEHIDSDEANTEEEDDSDDNDDDDDDDDTGKANANDAVEDAQQSVDEGMSHNIIISFFAA